MLNRYWLFQLLELMFVLIPGLLRLFYEIFTKTAFWCYLDFSSLVFLEQHCLSSVAKYFILLLLQSIH